MALYYALVKDLNPERKNWDALLGGDSIRLPVPGKPGGLTVSERKVSIESTPATEAIKEINPPASLGQVKEDRPSTPRIFGLDGWRSYGCVSFFAARIPAATASRSHIYAPFSVCP